MMELDGRDIHGELERRRPRRRFLAGFSKNPFTKADDMCALLGNGDERFGRNPSALRTFPARQRFEADHLPQRDSLLGLVVKEKIAAARCASEIGLQLAAFAQPRTKLLLEKPDGAAHF